MVENSVKHGISKIIEPGIIKVSISCNDLEVSIEVSDNGPAFSETPVSGYGLQSMYDKIEILYKGKASINWENTPEKRIIVTLPIKL